MSSIKQKNIGEIALTTGSTVNVSSGDVSAMPFVVADNATEYRVTGAETLSVSAFTINITAASGPTKNTKVVILWEAAATATVGNKVIIAGATVPDEMALGNFKAECTYNGSAWSVVMIPDMKTAGIITTLLLAASAVTTAKIELKNITTALLADLGVTAAKIANTTITTAKYALLSVTTAIIDDLAVTTGKIAATAVTTAKMALLSVTTAILDDLSVTTGKIAAAAVTASKLDANSNKYTRDIRLSFADAAQVGNVNFTIYEDCTIDEINVTVLQPALVDTATMIYKDNGGTVLTASQTDVTTGMAIGNVVSTTPTANNVFSAGQTLLVEMTKTTVGSCIVNISLCITKT